MIPRIKPERTIVVGMPSRSKILRVLLLSPNDSKARPDSDNRWVKFFKVNFFLTRKFSPVISEPFSGLLNYFDFLVGGSIVVEDL